jgi:hypothetical protein
VFSANFSNWDGHEELPYLLLLDGLGYIWSVSNSHWDHKGRLFPDSTIWWTTHISMFLTVDLLWKPDIVMVCEQWIKFGGDWYNDRMTLDLWINMVVPSIICKQHQSSDQETERYTFVCYGNVLIFILHIFSFLNIQEHSIFCLRKIYLNWGNMWW